MQTAARIYAQAYYSDGAGTGELHTTRKCAKRKAKAQESLGTVHTDDNTRAVGIALYRLDDL